MDLKTRARKLREQADAATAEASARWDDFAQARKAVEALGDDVDTSVAPEFAAAQAAQVAYNEAGDVAGKAANDYKAVLELMAIDSAEAIAQNHPMYEASEIPAGAFGGSAAFAGREAESMA